MEETAELQQILAKFITTDCSPEYWSGVDLNDKLVEELGDVLCALRFFTEHALTENQRDAVSARVFSKTLTYERWSRAADDSPPVPLEDLITDAHFAVYSLRNVAIGFLSCTPSTRESIAQELGLDLPGPGVMTRRERDREILRQVRVTGRVQELWNALP